ncbi:MAG TPA: DUF6569 family protein [Bryobacteraceae bacterium]|nr:DUF6569 family protein [Bryobacteraceae bacterium]
MSNRFFSRCLPLLGIAVTAAAQPSSDYRISGPYTHDNLSVFLVHARKLATNQKYLTLQEALDQKKVVVYETGSVNELAIQNVSSEEVYIQSGDIVKGGRQDRVLPEDTLLMPHSGKLPISAFCVEHGRWTGRGGEASDHFGSSNQALAGKGLKMAAREPGAQSKVWDEVQKAQQRLSSNLASGAVLASPSPTSMQLTLESKPVSEASEAYVKDLAKIVDGKSDVVGYAYAVNGKLNSADVYGSSDLFRRMWPKLLKASAVEALAEKNAAPAKPPVVEPATVRSALVAADGASAVSKDDSGRVAKVKKESDKAVQYETVDSAANAPVHKSVVLK